MSGTAVERSFPLRWNEAAALQQEMQQAYESLQSCFREMEEVLSRPTFDAGALTSIRLKLAGLRLTRGPLITRIALALAGHVNAEEAEMLAQLRASHQKLLQTATAHTSKWTLEAIGRQWSRYRDETRELMRQWMKKAEREQELVYPLVRRCVEPSTH